MEIKAYIALVRRWAWLILLGGLIAGSVAYAVSVNSAPEYRAEARLLIESASVGGTTNEYTQLLGAERLVATYVQLMQTQSVRRETAQRLGLTQLEATIRVSGVTGTQLIIITVEDTDSQRAAALANTIGEVFIENDNERQRARFADSIVNYEQRLEALSRQLEEIEINIQSLEDADSTPLQVQLSQLETQKRQLQNNYAQTFNNLETVRVESARQSNRLTLIEPATPPSRPFRPQVWNNTLLAVAVGIMLGLGIAFTIEYLDDTVKTPDQVMADTGLSTLAAIADIKATTQSESLVTHRMPRAPVSEAYRVMRTNLSFAAIDQPLEAMLVTSASPSEGKSTTAANLAIVMAQAGKQVILVDADLRRPSQHKLFEITNNQGLTTALLDSNLPVSEHLQKTTIPGLRLLTSGPLPPNPAELLNSHRMQVIIEMLKAESDVVIFDMPPALAVADAAILAPQVNGCALVVEVGKTRRDAFMQAVELLNKSGAQIFGVVMNRLRRGRLGYYDYYYYRYYSYESGDRKPAQRTGLLGWLTGLNNR
jgi:capsular exopolysaccharide synthesis family protein